MGCGGGEVGAGGMGEAGVESNCVKKVFRTHRLFHTLAAPPMMCLQLTMDLTLFHTSPFFYAAASVACLLCLPKAQLEFTL